MSNENPFDKLGKSAQRAINLVDDALMTGDFSNLSDEIGKAVGKATDEMYVRAQRGFEKNGTTYNAGHHEPAGYRSSYGGAARRSSPERGQSQDQENLHVGNKYFAPAQSPIPGTVVGVLGIAAAAGFGLVGLLAMLGTAIVEAGAAAIAITGVITAALTAASAIGGWFGFKKAKHESLFSKIRKKIAKPLYADIEDLANELNMNKDDLIKELKKMTAEGKFRQGHFDKDQKTFVASDEVYQYYLDLQQQEIHRQAEAAKKKKTEEGIDPEVLKLLENGNAYVRAIRDANDAIPDEEVTEKLSRMEDIVARIFAEVRKRPELARNLNMFMEYYLPTTLKLMNAYIEMDSVENSGENVQTAKREIENSLDTINDAFEKLLDSFFKDKAMDVSSEINVMKTMMKQDGLTPDELSKLRAEKKTASGEAATGPTLEFGSNVKVTGQKAAQTGSSAGKATATQSYGSAAGQMAQAQQAEEE